MYQNVSIVSWCRPVDCPPAFTAQMLNQPAFLIVPSGFSTIRVWLRGRFEIGPCANAEEAGIASSKASARCRRARIVFSLGDAFSRCRELSAQCDFSSIGISIHIKLSDTNA